MSQSGSQQHVRATAMDEKQKGPSQRTRALEGLDGSFVPVLMDEKQNVRAELVVYVHRQADYVPYLSELDATRRFCISWLQAKHNHEPRMSHHEFRIF